MGGLLNIFQDRVSSSLLFLLSFLVAFCSIVYELILAQSLSIMLGNTVLRYSITVGLYLFSLGMGTLAFAFWKRGKHTQLLFWIEIILASLGIALPFLIFGGDYWIKELLSSLSFSPKSSAFWIPSWIYMHALILIIGFLSGLELPILMEIGRTQGGKSLSQKVLAIDYMGTFVGAVAFPLFIFEHLGLVAGAAFTGSLNLFAALGVLFLRQEKSTLKPYVFCASACLLCFLIMYQESALRHLLMEYIFG